MKIIISRTTEYTKDDVPVESYDLRVESNVTDSSTVCGIYVELREKLNKAIKEETK